MAHAARKTFEVDEFKAADVWAAAFAAYRVNKGYYKNTHDRNSYIPEHVMMRNVDLMKAHLKGEFKITQEDYAEAERAKDFIRGYTISLMVGKHIGNFRISYLHAVEKTNWSSRDYLELGSLAYLPRFIQGEYEQAARDEEVRTQGTTGFLGEVGERVVFIGKVVKRNFSQNYNTYFVTVLTTSGKVCWFSFGKHVDVGGEYRFVGTVKRHTDDGQTQMNRVKFS